MSYTNRSMESNDMEDDLNCRGLAQKISKKNLNILPTEFSCDILVKNVFDFTHV